MTDAKLSNLLIQDIVYGSRFRNPEDLDVTELMEDISKNQLIHPIAVKETADGKFLLLAGGRRLTACTKLGYATIAAHIYPNNLDELEVRSIELAENIHRKDMSFSERAKLTSEIHRLFETKHGIAHKSSGGHSLEDTAKLISKSRETVRQDIELADAIEIMPEVGRAKNRTEALRLWNKERLNVLHEELAKRLEERSLLTDTDKKKQDVANSYVIGDFFECIKSIPNETIHLCEVDPPYGIDLQNIKKTKFDKGYALDAYNEIPAEDYLAFLDKTIKECYRILVPNAWLIFWFAPEPWFEPVYRTLIANGFHLKRMPAIWSKTAGAFQCMWPEFELANSFEHFFYARKGLATLNRQGRPNTFAYEQVPPNKKIHPTERPVEMIQAVLDTFCLPGSRIVVPFAGSGNTLLAAANLGMPAIGWDLCKDYRNSFVVRANDSEPGLYKSYGE